VASKSKNLTYEGFDVHEDDFQLIQQYQHIILELLSEIIDDSRCQLESYEVRGSQPIRSSQDGAETISLSTSYCPFLSIRVNLRVAREAVRPSLICSG
jgi:hypothetical protein